MAKSFQDLVQEAKQQIGEVTVDQVKRMLDAGERFTLIDVREADEYRDGYIDGAQYVGRGVLESKIGSLQADHDATIVTYCAGGFRSALAAKSLKDMGYTNVLSMEGGFGRWKNAGYPTVKPHKFTAEQVVRYSRHFLLNEVGEAGQKRLLDAKVLLVGMGGLGTPAAYYLAAAGVGAMGIMDADVVDTSNLQRQIMYNTKVIGKPKVEIARQVITDLNPDVHVIPYAEHLTEANAIEIFKQYDLVVDGCDNFPTRYLVNDASVLTGTPVVHGSIFQFEGQATVFAPGRGPCYRCLFPAPPPVGLVPN